MKSGIGGGGYGGAIGWTTSGAGYAVTGGGGTFRGGRVMGE